MGKKVLVIDDDPGIVKLDEALLKSKGYEVISAGDGLSGVERAIEDQPDVIILDVILPNMHGFEVCKNLKNNPNTESIPIVMVTATGLEDIAESESDIQADAYLAKPYGIDKLEEAIQTAIHKKTQNPPSN